MDPYVANVIRENTALLKEVELLKSVFETHYSSLVMNLRLKNTRGGGAQWIDIQKSTVQELQVLVQDEEIRGCIEHKQRPYRDRDY
jgi:hypothetical protein